MLNAKGKRQNVRMEPPCLGILHFAFCLFHFALNMEGESPTEPSCLDSGDDPVPDPKPAARSPMPVHVDDHERYDHLFTASKG